jgi:hypothetical protein
VDAAAMTKRQTRGGRIQMPDVHFRANDAIARGYWAEDGERRDGG